MSHYDENYEEEAALYQLREMRRALRQLRVMEEFVQTLHSSPGTQGISSRHLDAVKDMINETRVRAGELYYTQFHEQNQDRTATNIHDQKKG